MEQATMAVGQERQRVRGALLLSACGDALGVPFDGATRVAPAAVDTVLAAVEPLHVGDCTAATLVVAEHVARRGGALEPAALGRELAARRSRPPEDLPEPPRAAVWAPVLPGLAGRKRAQGGAVAAVSALPLGLVAGQKLAEVAERARQAAAVSQPDPLVGDAAAVLAVAVALAATWPQGDPLDPELFVSQLASHLRHPDAEQVLAAVPALVETLAAPGRVATALGGDRSPVRAVLAAVTAFLRHGRSPWSAVRFAICVGGDTAATAAATGALCGAYLGERLVPSQWMDRLGRVVRLRAAASALADA